jgi:hypothetical protein
MNTVQKFIGHLKTVTKHRFYVFYYCCKAGIPIRGLLHDLSKFSPVEFWESVKYYQGTSSPINACKKENGYSNAWLHHKGRNPHHYEYWQDNFDNGGVPLEMPYEYVMEMICDFLAAGRAYNGKNFTYEKEWNWWLEKISHPVAMHTKTKEFVNEVMRILYITQTDTILSKKCSKPLFDHYHTQK